MPSPLSYSFDFSVCSTVGYGRTRTGECVRMLQDFLNSYGFSSGSADGKFGPKTKKALIDFQKVNGLIADGVAGKKTFNKINMLKGGVASQSTVELSTFSSQYIKPYPTDPWPPIVQHNATAYSCSTISRDVFGTPTILTGTQNNINGRTFCIYSFSDGGAGHYAGVYTYITAELNGIGTERVDFRVDWGSCGVWQGDGTTKYSDCQIAQSTFFNNLDVYIASLM